MQNLEGKIHIVYQQESGQVQIDSQRPLHARLLFIGKPRQQVSEMLPRLFSICAHAQTYAGICAMASARGDTLPAVVHCYQQIAVWLETAREHMMRMIIDWPKLLKLRISPAQCQPAFIAQLSYKPAQKAKNSRKENINNINYLTNSLDNYLEKYIFGIPVQKWLKIEDKKQLWHWAEQHQSIAAQSLNRIFTQQWMAQGAHTQAQFLPEMALSEIKTRIWQGQQHGFCSQPDWQGQYCETTSYARQQHHPLLQQLKAQYGNGLLCRWLARLLELAGISTTIRKLLAQQNTCRSDSTDGIARVQAARGQLIHTVKMQQDTVVDYHILAPTEWNFHPQGVVKQSLQQIQSHDQAQWLEIAHCLINSIDPCVQYELRIA